MSTQSKSLSKNPALKGSNSLNKKELVASTPYLVELHEPFKSIDIPNAQLRNYLNFKSDKKCIYDIRSLIAFVGEVVELEKLPIRPPQDETSYFLMNDPESVAQQIRYGSIQKEIGFKEELTEIAKFEFNDDFHRVFVHLKKGKVNVLKIILFDPFHHVAFGLKGRKSLYWNYERCSGEHGKKDCFSMIPDLQ